MESVCCHWRGVIVTASKIQTNETILILWYAQKVMFAGLNFFWCERVNQSGADRLWQGKDAFRHQTVARYFYTLGEWCCAAVPEAFALRTYPHLECRNMDISSNCPRGLAKCLKDLLVILEIGVEVIGLLRRVR